MADVSKMAEEWLSEHPDATKKENGWLVIGNLPITGATEPSKFQNYGRKKSETRNHAFDDS